MFNNTLDLKGGAGVYEGTEALARLRAALVAYDRSYANTPLVYAPFELYRAGGYKLASVAISPAAKKGRKGTRAAEDPEPAHYLVAFISEGALFFCESRSG